MDLGGVELLARRSLHAELTERVRELILEGRLEPGKKISERTLCAAIGVSRTPLREALKVLASEGIVTLSPNRGASVSPITRREIVEVFELLGALEAFAGALACKHIAPSELAEIETLQDAMLRHYSAGDRPNYFKCNQEIHAAILRASRNETLLPIHNALSNRIRRCRYLANFSEERWRQAVDEHEQIMTALRLRRSDRVAELLAAHFEHKLQSVLAQIDAAGEPGGV
jgi:DNA-binding GntR family transcriptional regulator